MKYQYLRTVGVTAGSHSLDGHDVVFGQSKRATQAEVYFNQNVSSQDSTHVPLNGQTGILDGIPT
jgi:hypothetical protein